MAKSFLRLDARRALSDGSYPIQIAVGYNTDVYISTGVSAHKENWDSRTALYVGPNAKRINNLLSTLLVQVSHRVLDLRENGMLSTLTKAQIKAMLKNPDAKTPPPVMANAVGPVFRRVIATKNKRNAELYTSTLDKLKIYCDVEKCTFDSITKNWLNEFCASAGMKSLAINTKAIHLRNLRNVFNFAIDENITNNYPFRRYTIQKEETPMRVLPIDAMRSLLSMDLNERMQEYRDVFMLSFYLIGINIVDLSRLTSSSIIDGRIEYRRAKTGKYYSIKLTDEANAIIEKYRGEKHLLRCFDRYDNYKDYAQHLNYALGQMLPNRKEITTYWARYSWATYAAKIQIAKDTISDALGHEHGSRITSIYIEYDRAIVDEANRKVINFVLEKNLRRSSQTSADSTITVSH